MRTIFNATMRVVSSLIGLLMVALGSNTRQVGSA